MKSNGVIDWRGAGGSTLVETDLASNPVNEYVFFNQARIAQRDASGNIYYYFADHLGSTRVVTDASGVPCYQADFTPYGGELTPSNFSNSCLPNYRFTGYEYDQETQNNYAFARYYSPHWGRFLSLDPVDGAPGDSQSWNKYTYVGNNAGNVTDPTGLDDGDAPSFEGVFSVFGTGVVGGFFDGGGFIGLPGVWGQIFSPQLADTSAVTIGSNPFSFLLGGVQGLYNQGVGLLASINGRNHGAVSEAVTQRILDMQIQPGNQVQAVGMHVGPLLFALIPGFGEADFGEALAGEAASELPDSALVARGGSLANHTPAKINAAIGPSRTPGVIGFSAQCNGGGCLSELGQFLRNRELGVTTVGEIRQIGGQVVRTPGIGYHVTVTGVSGEGVSPLLRIFPNPNPLVGP
jgi:RHS repeat-associated protein